MALDGVVANNAKHALGEFDVEVTLKDCEDKTKETNCKVVGQARGTAKPDVPTGQTRSFSTSDLRFDNLRRVVQVQCATQPCNAGRVFNWRVTESIAHPITNFGSVTPISILTPRPSSMNSRKFRENASSLFRVGDLTAAA
jgi:hypothetical protein